MTTPAGNALSKAIILVRHDRRRVVGMTWRLRIFEFLAVPAHGWLWVCAKLVRLDFTCGPVEDED